MPSKTVRLPLTGSHVNRVSATNALDTSSGYVGVGIVGIMIVGSTTASSNKDQRFVNCFGISTVDRITGVKRIYAVKRPGWGTDVTPEAGSVGAAILVWTGQGSGTKRISAFGTTNSNIYNGDTLLGAITGKCTGLTETFVSTTPTICISSDDNTGWYYDTGVGVPTKITDVDFPGNAGKTIVGTFAHLDGFACIATSDGLLYASDVNSMTAWTATSYDSANAYPDKGVGCVRHRNYIIVFGTESMQFFENRGLTPFPLVKVTSLTQKIGAISADAIAQLSDTTFWAGSTAQSGISIYKYDNGVARISTPEVDSLLILAGSSNISLTTLRHYGRSFLLVLAATVQLVYCVEEDEWFEYTSSVPICYKCAGVSIGGTMVSYAVSKHSTSGKVFIQNQAALTYQDNGMAFTARMQMALMGDQSNNRCFWEEAELLCDVESGSTATLLSSDDDYQNYTTLATLDLSTERPRATRLGSSRRRSWIITHSANTPFRAEALKIRYSVGSG